MAKPTELERVLTALERDADATSSGPGATLYRNAARLLREMAMDFEALTRYIEKESSNDRAKAARARWRLP